jgi:hypothetical protein
MKQSGANLQEWIMQYLYQNYTLQELQNQAWAERQEYYRNQQQQRKAA